MSQIQRNIPRGPGSESTDIPLLVRDDQVKARDKRESYNIPRGTLGDQAEPGTDPAGHRTDRSPTCADETDYMAHNFGTSYEVISARPEDNFMPHQITLGHEQSTSGSSFSLDNPANNRLSSGSSAHSVSSSNRDSRGVAVMDIYDSNRNCSQKKISRESQISSQQLRFSGLTVEEIKTELHWLARENNWERLEVACEVLQSMNYKLSEECMLGNKYRETALDVATIKNSTASASILVDYGGGELILKTYDSMEYAGITALHLAIMKNNKEIVDIILKSLDETEKFRIFEIRAHGKYFKDRYTFAWYPVILAAAVGSIEIFDSLVYHGADPLMKDPETDNTIYHSLARVSLNAPELASSMLLKILDSPTVDTWWQGYREQSCYSNLAEELLKHKNKDGYTPLSYATCLGATKFAATILDVDYLYKYPQWRVGSDQLTFYELSEIDPAVPDTKSRASVLEAYAFVSSEQKLEFGKIPAIRQTMLNKWDVYHTWFYSWFVYHIILMLVFTLCIVHRFMPWTNTEDGQAECNSTGTDDQHDVFLDGTHCHFGVLFIFLETFVMLSAVLYFSMELYDIITLTRKKYWSACGFSRRIKIWLTVQFDIFRVILFIFSCSVFVLVVLRVVRSEWQDLAYAISSLAGWSFLLFFMRAFENIGIFTIMMAEMIKKELSYFLVVITIIICGIGVAMFCMFQGSPDIPDQVQTLRDTFFSLFRLMVGLEELDIFEEARVPWIMRVLFVLFILLTNILLLNMMIAAMNNTYNHLDSHKELMWMQTRTKAVLLIERRLPIRLRPSHRLKSLDNERPNSWFLCSTEVTENHPLANLTEQSFISI